MRSHAVVNRLRYRPRVPYFSQILLNFWRNSVCVKSCGDHVSLQKCDLLTVEDWSVSCSSPLCLSSELHFHEQELDRSEFIFVSFVGLDGKLH